MVHLKQKFLYNLCLSVLACISLQAKQIFVSPDGNDTNKDNPDQIYLTDQTYYDLKYNIKLDTLREFNTSKKVLKGYKITEMRPDKH